MVRSQLEPRGIREPAVLEAMAAVPREEFVEEANKKRAYCDGALPIGLGQTISQPYMVAVMTQHALSPEVSRGGKFKRVLEVGGGSGYQAAILSFLAEEVFTVERVPGLADRAQETLERLGYSNVKVILGDGTLGLPDKAPFDAIIVAAAAPTVPEALRDQLSLGGRLVIPVGSRGFQQLMVIERTEAGFHTDFSTQCVFVPLIGEYGWPS